MIGSRQRLECSSGPGDSFLHSLLSSCSSARPLWRTRSTSNSPLSISYDAGQHVLVSGSRVQLPFDLEEVVGNFYYERYARQPLNAKKRVPVPVLTRPPYALAKGRAAAGAKVSARRTVRALAQRG